MNTQRLRQLAQLHSDIADTEEWKASDLTRELCRLALEAADALDAQAGDAAQGGVQADDMTRLQEIEARCEALDPGPWQWSHSYEMWDGVHWALESPKSAAEGKVVTHLLVLDHDSPETIGEKVEDNPYLAFIARSRDDIEWLCQQVRTTLQRRPQAQGGE